MLESIAHQCRLNGYYVLSAGTLNPATVLQRLIDAVVAVAPTAQLQKAVLRSYSTVPAYALDDDASAWWDTGGADRVLSEIFEAINESLPSGLLCTFQAPDRFLIESSPEFAALSTDALAPTTFRRSAARAASSSALRAAAKA